jgi:hypothetical protein
VQREELIGKEQSVNKYKKTGCLKIKNSLKRIGL